MSAASGRSEAWRSPRWLGPALMALISGACMGPAYEPPDFEAREKDFPEPKPPAFVPQPQPALEPLEGDQPTSEPTPATEPAPAEARQPLTLDEVLDSVYERYPPYLSVLLEQDLASAQLQQALGAFDTNFFAKAGRNFSGFYSATVGQALLEQPLWTGGSVYGGYRLSDGLLPDYYEARTQTGGEFAVGGRFPLLRDREIDSRRLKLRQEQIDQALADPRIAQGRIDFILAATRSYNQWVAEGLRLSVAEELLGLAQARAEGIAQGVELRFLAGIDKTDNQRLIVQREILVVRARRSLEQASLALSLFLRTPEDEPIVPGRERLPDAWTTPVRPDWASFQEVAVGALPRRPELRRIELLIDRTRTDQALADNQLLPNLDVKVDASQDVDDSPYKDLNEFELFAGLEFKLPMQRRLARGLLRQATTELERLQIERNFARDRVLNEISDALSALQAAFDQIDQAGTNVRLARELVAAEQESFRLGRSDLLRINLREIQLAEAEVAELEVQLAYHQAAANYRAALALDALPPAERP